MGENDQMGYLLSLKFIVTLNLIYMGIELDPFKFNTRK